MALDPANPEAVRKAAHDIVAQSQFVSQHDSKLDRVLFYMTHPISLLDLIFNWVISQFVGQAIGHTIIASIVAVAIAAVIVFLVIRFGRTTTRNRSVQVHYAPPVSNKSVKQLLADAEALERDEKWRDAIRLRYAALVQSLAERGVVRARDGRTTGEYAAEVLTNAPDIAGSFAAATRIFEWIWYGGRDAGRSDVDEFKSLAAQSSKKAAA